MLFSSLLFLFAFLPIVIGVYHLVMAPVTLRWSTGGWVRKLANLWLLLASLFFYAWGELRVLWAMLMLITVSYVFGVLIGRSRERSGGAAGSGRAFLILSLAVNLGVLAFYKYANFTVANLNGLAHAIGAEALVIDGFAEIALPLGISFYTFQSLSYTIDVYRGTVPATRNLIDFACYIAMFPQLVAGPIVRYTDIARELVSRTVSRGDFAAGALRFSIGLGKKVLVANTVAVPADHVFSLATDQLDVGNAWLGILCYTLQIYFDFSAYSDMAIGLGLMFGFHFVENFRYPYIARSNTDFWRRWHISLSSWFRDYLYIPLGGNRVGPGRTYFNLFLVFFLCGLWHGASWNFVIWGLYHGVFLILERRFIGAVLERLWRPLQHAYLLVVAMVGWVLFRAESPEQIQAFLAAMCGLGEGAVGPSHLLRVDLVIALTLGVLFATPVYPWFTQVWARAAATHGAGREVAMAATSAVVRPAVTFTLLVLSAMSLSAGTHNPFIYFRF